MNRTLADRYQLTSMVAKGGTGALWRGVDHGTGRPVAVKLVYPNLVGDRVADRLQRARPALSGLWHPGIVRLLDLVADGGTLCLVTEFVPGTDLAQLLLPQRRGARPLSPEVAAHTAAAMADALQAAHRSGVVHGDLKPSNVLLPQPRAGGPVRLTDFSVAALVRSTQPQLASSSSYSPPWALGGGTPPPASDVYALGVILWQMLTGATTLDGAGAHVDPRLREVVLWCTAGDQAPPPTAGEVSQRLRELVGPPDGTVAIPGGAGGSPDGSGAPARPHPAVAAAAPARRRRHRRRTAGRIAVAVLAATVVAGGVVAAVDLFRQPDPAGPPASPELRPTNTSQAAPALPPEAADNTREGGAAFVRFWFAALTYAVQSGETSGLAEVTSPECVDCQQVIDAIETTHGAGGRFQGGGYVVRGVSTNDFWSLDRPVYDATVDRSPRTTVDASGAPQATLAPLSFANCALVLEWTDDRWLVREVVSTGCVA